MKHYIRPMTIDDFDHVHNLWLNVEHMLLNECDTREGITFYLNRNPGLCFVAQKNDKIIGSILCGHDGRRGYIRHLAVAKECRGLGLGSMLIKSSLNGLHDQGIGKCLIFVEDDNVKGLEFWATIKWKTLDYTFRTLITSTENYRENI